MSLDGSSVLVTGGTRGIGLAIALRLVGDGARRVVLGYMRNDDAAEQAAESVRGAGGEPVLVRGEGRRASSRSSRRTGRIASSSTTLQPA